MHPPARTCPRFLCAGDTESMTGQLTFAGGLTLGLIIGGVVLVVVVYVIYRSHPHNGPD